MEKDIVDYAKDGRLTELSDGKRYEWRNKIKTGKVSAIRFSTLNAICDVLDCQPGDILEFQKDQSDNNTK